MEKRKILHIMSYDFQPPKESCGVTVKDTALLSRQLFKYKFHTFQIRAFLGRLLIMGINKS